MSKISNYFQQMNERFVPNWFDYVSAIFYLNENFPSWREEIRNPGEWQDAFSFRVHVYKGCNSEEFASRMFDAIQNDEALRFVWQNEGLNDFYRICAAKRLIALDKDRYYTEYVEVLRGGSLSASSREEVLSLFDIPSGVEVAAEMALDTSNYKANASACLFLREVADEKWNEYPEEVKAVLFDKYGEYLALHCSEKLWNSYDLRYKIRMGHYVSVEEYKLAHDLLNIYQYLYDRDKKFLNIFSNDVRDGLYRGMDVKDILMSVSKDMIFNNCLRFLQDSDYPKIDFTNSMVGYKPSSKFRKFKERAESSGDRDVCIMLDDALNDLKAIIRENRFDPRMWYRIEYED